MNTLDWIVLFGTIVFIVLYGTLKTKENKNIESYLKGDNSMKWWMIGVSIMATQASAITFLSTPGQAIEDGMRFLQFYFGLPIAMVIISVTMVPIYYKLKVFTAYEYLETRFDLKTRSLAAILFFDLTRSFCGYHVVCTCYCSFNHIRLANFHYYNNDWRAGNYIRYCWRNKSSESHATSADDCNHEWDDSGGYTGLLYAA